VKENYNHVTFDSNPAKVAGFWLHNNDSCSRVNPCFFPYDHVTGRSNYNFATEHMLVFRSIIAVKCAV
jgi:hypothetical protein